jgi:hypothetical protein
MDETLSSRAVHFVRSDAPFASSADVDVATAVSRTVNQASRAGKRRLVIWP